MWMEVRLHRWAGFSPEGGGGMSPMTLVDGGTTRNDRLAEERDAATRRLTELAAAIREHEESLRSGPDGGGDDNDRASIGRAWPRSPRPVHGPIRAAGRAAPKALRPPAQLAAAAARPARRGGRSLGPGCRPDRPGDPRLDVRGNG